MPDFFNQSNPSMEQSVVSQSDNKQNVSDFMNALQNVGAGSNNTFMNNPNRGSYMPPNLINPNVAYAPPSYMQPQMNYMPAWQQAGFFDPGFQQRGYFQPGWGGNSSPFDVFQQGASYGGYGAGGITNPNGSQQGSVDQGGVDLTQSNPWLHNIAYTPIRDQNSWASSIINSGRYSPVVPPWYSNLNNPGGPYVNPNPVETNTGNPVFNPGVNTTGSRPVFNNPGLNTNLANNWATVGNNAILGRVNPGDAVTNNAAVQNPDPGAAVQNNGLAVSNPALSQVARTSFAANPATNNSLVASSPMVNAVRNASIYATPATYSTPANVAPTSFASSMASPFTSAYLRPASNMFGGLMMSDETQKQDVEPANPQIKDFLNQINAYNYTYKNPERDGQGTFTSPMAQELEKTELGKQAVVETPQGKMVNYARLGGVNLAAVSVLYKEQEKMKAQLNNLAQKLNKGK